MIQSLLIIFVVILIFWGIRHIRQQPPEKKRKTTLNFALYALIGITLLLVVTGRMHWLAGAIAALFPILQKLGMLALKAWPFLSAMQKKQQEQQNSRQAPSHSSTMDVDQALQVFGLKTVDSTEQIIQRHRELMQKNHPDRGGSDFIAAQINEAKTVLLNHTKT